MPNLIKRKQTTVPSVYHDPKCAGHVERASAKETDLWEYLRVIWRRKWLVLTVILAVVGGVALQTYRATPLYKSTVKIQIGPQENILPYQQLYQSYPGGDPLSSIYTQIEVLSSLNLAHRVVEQLRLSEDPAKVLKQTKLLLADLEVTAIPATEIVKVSYSSEDPAFAAKIVNTWTEEYIKYDFESRYEAFNRAKEFLHKELLNLKQKLELSEANLIRYGQKKNVSEQDKVHLMKLDELNQQMAKVESQLIANKYRDIRDATGENFPASLKTSVMQDLESRLSTLQQNLAALSIQFGPKSPAIIRLKHEIAETQHQLDDERKQRIEQERIEYNLVQAHYKRLVLAIEKQRELVNRLSEDAIQYNILKREVDIDKQIYQGLLARLGEVGVSTDLRTANIQVIDRGEVPSSPYFPNTFMNLTLGLAVGIVLGVILAFAREYVDKTLITPEQVEQTFGLPSLAVIPSLGKSWNKTNGQLLAPSESDSQDTKMIQYINSMSSERWESFRWLRMSLLLSIPDTSPQTILVTSSLPGEGKTTTCVNLGISFAQMGARTVILELDMRKPGLAKRFKVNETQGISSYLAGRGDLSTQVSKTGIPNLFVVPAGPIPSNPPELLGSPRMELALEWLSQNFQHIIIDSPPLLAVTDAVVISIQVDGVLLLVRAGQTPRDAVHKARHLLTGVGARILGIVVNGADFYRVKNNYYYS